MLKSEVRRVNRLKRDELDQSAVISLSHAISESVLCSEAYKNSDIVLTYLCFRNEPDTSEIIFEALREGKRVAAPVVKGSDMDFYFIHRGEEYRTGAYGIREPRDRSEENRFNPEPEAFRANAKDSVLMLVPGLGFDKKGNRVGYGAGYYDRYLNEHANIPIHTCGICYDFMLMDSIEADHFDRSVKSVITPSFTLFIS